MRITTLLLGLLTSIGLFTHSIVASIGHSILEVGGEVFGDQEAIEIAEDLAPAIGAGITVAVVGTVAAGLALKFPRASCILFMISAGILIPTGATTLFEDLLFWGSLFAICAVFSFFGQRSERRWPLSLLLSGSPAIVAASTASNLQRFCTQCGHNIAGYRFCNQCGQKAGS